MAHPCKLAPSSSPCPCRDVIFSLSLLADSFASVQVAVFGDEVI